MTATRHGRFKKTYLSWRLPDWPGREAFAAELEVARGDLPYDIDDCVIKFDPVAPHAGLGSTSRAPHCWVVARKFATEEAVTRLRAVITWQIGARASSHRWPISSP